MKHTPESLANLKKLRTPVRNINAERYGRLSLLDRFAVFVTRRVGTMGFFLIILFWTIFWVGWNIFAPKELIFDPYPAFVLWLIISNAIQICILPLIMVGQNLEGRHAEARAEADYEVNTRSEREVEAILMHLENQNEMLANVLEELRGKRRAGKK